MTGKGKKRYLKTALCVLGVIVIASAILTGIYRKEIKLRYLIYKVDRDSYEEAVWAAGELGKMGEDAEAAIPELVQHMGVYLSREPYDYRPFRKGLINIGQPAIEYLKDYMNDPESKNTYGATLTLGLGGPECAAFLVEKLSDENERKRTSIILGFTGMGRDDYNETLNIAKGALISILMNDESPHNRRFAIYALTPGDPDEEILDGLCLALADKDFPLKQAAISALGRSGFPSRAVDCLKKALYDENYTVGWLAVDSLRYIGPEPEVIETLIEAIIHKDDGVRSYAIETLLKFEKDTPQITEALLSALENNEDPGVRASAVEGLGKIGPEPGVVDALTKALDDEDVSVRGGAIIGLTGFGADAEPALEKLRYSAENDLARVPGHLPNCEEALKAIEEIEKAIEENRVGVTESE